MADNNKIYPSGLTEKEAQEFHDWYLKGFIIFMLASVVAHVFVFTYLPWFPTS